MGTEHKNQKKLFISKA